MITCPNKNLQEWKDLVSQVGEARAYLLWDITKGDTTKLEEVNFELKSVNILQSNKAKEIFEKGKKNNWDLNKILTELAIPKEQKQLILDKGFRVLTNNDARLSNEPDLREQIIIDLLSNYSYTVEINTAKSEPFIDRSEIDTYIYNNDEYIDAGFGYYKNNNIEITKQQYNEAVKNGKRKFEEKPLENSKYYSNLTVPGGTNYTENEIATPAITPSIKGHAQFSTDKGIGWFRSDDKENKIVGWKEEDDFLNSETAQYNPITKDDKVIFGHPTIGKSYLKKQGNNDFITLDDDYADEVNAFIDANRGKETRQEYKGRKPKEYNQFMLNLFDRLKLQAKKEGKRLFVSNTNILKERMSDFDKVITIPKDEFKKRFDARGATYGFEDWKSDIDATVAKVDKSKVISTRGYLSDLLEGNPKTRRILEVQSDLFQKGRDKEDLINFSKVKKQVTDSELIKNLNNLLTANPFDYEVIYNNKTFNKLDNGAWVYKNEFVKRDYDYKNDFLQLLNKDNNWVTFFVKSIIQDTAKQTITEVQESDVEAKVRELEKEGLLEIDCKSKLKAKDGIATLFEKGGKWEIVTDFKNAPTHKLGGKDISIQGKKVEVEKNELRIENDFGDVAVIPSKYRVEVKDAIKSNCHSCIDGIVESLPKMKDYAGDGTVFPFFGRYKRFKNSLPDNLKNTSEDEYAMRYYWKHNNKPKSFDEAIKKEQPMFTMEDDGYYHAPSVESNTLRFLKPKNHPTLQYELDWYNSDNPDAVDFRNKYDLDTSGRFYKYVPKKLGQ